MISLRTDNTYLRHPSLPKGRALHLLDVENLLGDPYSGQAAVTALLVRYRRRHVEPGDQVVIAANPHLGVKAKFAWPEALVRWERGPNGADNALLAEASPADIARRFDRLVVGSGDHIFEARVAQVRALGVPVHVVYRPGSISKQLRRRATTAVALPVPVARGEKEAA